MVSPKVELLLTCLTMTNIHRNKTFTNIKLWNFGGKPMVLGTMRNSLM